MTKPVVIVVDGIISVGKSTYIEMLSIQLQKRGWKVTIVKEPVEKWNSCGILQRFYADPGRWAYHFQTKAFHDRVVENIEMFEKFGATSDVFILERSPFTDTLFMEMLHEAGHVDALEMEHYREWWKLWIRVMPYKPDLFIYLKAGIDKCMDRVRQRNREGEEGVSKTYQEALQAKHDSFFGYTGQIDISGNDVPHNVPCQILIVDDDFRNDQHIQDMLTLHFEDLIKSVSRS